MNIMEKAKNYGITFQPVLRQDGSIIAEQFDFKYRGEECKTWIDSSHQRAYAIKENKNDYYGIGVYVNSLEDFINKFDELLKYRR